MCGSALALICTRGVVYLEVLFRTAWSPTLTMYVHAARVAAEEGNVECLQLLLRHGFRAGVAPDLAAREESAEFDTQRYCWHLLFAAGTGGGHTRKRKTGTSRAQPRRPIVSRKLEDSSISHLKGETDVGSMGVARS